MSETPSAYQPTRAYRPGTEVEALLDASFTEAHMRPCVCGAMLGPREGVCHVCATGNRALGPIYGASLAQSARPAPCPACAALRAENAELKATVVRLQGEITKARYQREA